MSVRDEKLNWKPEALRISKEVEDVLRPILDKALMNSLSFEDFYYIVGDAAHLLVLQRERIERHNQI